MSVEVIHADCNEAIKSIADASIDACVTDPPYALVSIVKRLGGANAAPIKDRDGVYKRAAAGFMGKRWDTGDTAFNPAFWREVLRVLKPGAHVVAFSGTRTYHRLACAIEDAGFEIRDQIGWMYGSGFPKSHKVGDGLGTALKPAWEPIVLARRPIDGASIRECVRTWGTGGLNIDACRIATVGEVNPSVARRQGAVNHLSDRPARETEAEGRIASRQSPEAFRAERPGEAAGRWPANVIHDGSEEVVEAFPDTRSGSGAIKRATGAGYKANAYGAESRPVGTPMISHGDTGSAARFFYSAKADAADRLGSKHPTVKPVDLMAYLIRLVTPKGGLVLDPFAGSGTTGMAAMREGVRAVLIEREAEYVADIRLRIAHVRGEDSPLFNAVDA